MAITIRAIEVRLFLMVPTITMAAGLVTLRMLQLLHRKWALIPSFIIAVVLGQISAALNYLRIDPITFGLLLLGPTYALTSFSEGFFDHRGSRRRVLEPLIVLIVVWTVALIFR
jgi:hypothetical protein